MKAYQAYVSKLEELVSTFPEKLETAQSAAINAALDGQASRELRILVELNQLRKDGAFFSGSVLSMRLLENILPSDNGYIYDPACGAGDLLLAAAGYLAVQKTVYKTLTGWGKRLAGTDIHPEFIRATHLRLTLLALSRGAVSRKSLDLEKLADFFPQIKVADAFTQTRLLKKAKIVVTNPPFNRVSVFKSCLWTSGSTSNAAVFLDWIASNASPGVSIRAILPEVLRSGSSFKSFRQHLEKLLKITNIESVGQFEKSVDIDVFLLSAIRSDQGTNVANWSNPEPAKEKFENYFRVSVGAFVPFRATGLGGLHPYIHPRTLEPWGELSEIGEHKRFDGRLVLPPFIAIRRTSRPGDRHRAIATIIKGTQPVAVENHIIVCEPVNGQLSSCRSAMTKLKDFRTTEWYNKRLRCRHLTVSSVRELPWWQQDI